MNEKTRFITGAASLEASAEARKRLTYGSDADQLVTKALRERLSALERARELASSAADSDVSYR